MSKHSDRHVSTQDEVHSQVGACFFLEDEVLRRHVLQFEELTYQQLVLLRQVSQSAEEVFGKPVSCYQLVYLGDVLRLALGDVHVEQLYQFLQVFVFGIL